MIRYGKSPGQSVSPPGHFLGGHSLSGSEDTRSASLWPVRVLVPKPPSIACDLVLLLRRLCSCSCHQCTVSMIFCNLSSKNLPNTISLASSPPEEIAGQKTSNWETKAFKKLALVSIWACFPPCATGCMLAMHHSDTGKHLAFLQGPAWGFPPQPSGSSPG